MANQEYYLQESYFPNRIEIELTNECNSICGYCPRRFMKYEHGFMDPTLFRKLINEISAYKDRTLVLFRRGESLLHPEFISMLNYCKGKFREIQISTNASLMNEAISHALSECIDFISFSIELPERYKKYRSLDYSVVLKNINFFISINKRARTQVSIVNTEDIIVEHLDKFRKEWMGKVDRVRVYEQHSKDGYFGSLNGFRGDKKSCVKPFNDILIFWDGKVGRCNHDWGIDPLDSVVAKNISAVWHSDRYKKLRQQHLLLRIKDKVCKKCDSWYESVGSCEIGLVYEK